MQTKRLMQVNFIVVVDRRPSQFFPQNKKSPAEQDRTIFYGINDDANATTTPVDRRVI
jgi:hypothetical protein